MKQNSNKLKKKTSAPAGKSAQEKQKEIIMELRQSAESFSKDDIADWRRAWEAARYRPRPDRCRLYDIYRDAMVDSHLTGCIQQRMGLVMSRPFQLVNAKGEKDQEATHLLFHSWFKKTCRYILDSIWWGHSLIQLGDVVTDGDGHKSFSSVFLFPRKHVIPEYGRVVTRQGDRWQNGIDYRRPPYADYLVEAGDPDDLGLLLKAAQHTIPKKHALMFWDAFAEIFGIPMRIARTNTRDPLEYARVRNMLRNSGSALSLVMGMDTEIQIVESSKGDAFNVYDKRVDRANSELSKLITTQTMTTEDGSSHSQSETHLKMLESLVEDDRDMLSDVINNQILPLMIRHAFPVKGLRFEWAKVTKYTPEQQVAYETMIVDRFEVDPVYFADKYNMPVGKRLQPAPLSGLALSGGHKLMFTPAQSAPVPGPVGPGGSPSPSFFD